MIKSNLKRNFVQMNNFKQGKNACREIPGKYVFKQLPKIEDPNKLSIGFTPRMSRSDLRKSMAVQIRNELSVVGGSVQRAVSPTIFTKNREQDLGSESFII